MLNSIDKVDNEFWYRISISATTVALLLLSVATVIQICYHVSTVIQICYYEQRKRSVYFVPLRLIKLSNKGLTSVYL